MLRHTVPYTYAVYRMVFYKTPCNVPLTRRSSYRAI